jgi:hypothetical protein
MDRAEPKGSARFASFKYWIFEAAHEHLIFKIPTK